MMAPLWGFLRCYRLIDPDHDGPLSAKDKFIDQNFGCGSNSHGSAERPRCQTRVEPVHYSIKPRAAVIYESLQQEAEMSLTTRTFFKIMDVTLG